MSKRGFGHGRRRMAHVAIVAFLTPWAGLQPVGAQAPEVPDPCPGTVFLGDYPADADPGWSELLNGVAHDEGHWFITQERWLWKIPVGSDLNDESDPLPPEIRSVRIPPRLRRLRYDHFGDLHEMGGFLFVPLEDNEAPFRPPLPPGWPSPPPYVPAPAAIAVFRASDLSLVGLKVTSQEQSPWIAFNPIDKLLYTSDNTVQNDRPLYRYTLDLDTLAAADQESDSSRKDALVDKAIIFKDRFSLYESDGRPLAERLGRYMQGGVFTPWGDLYLVNGRAAPGNDDRRAGIHVFDSEGRLITDSRNPGLDSQGTFVFEYDPTAPQWQEPEGIDWWDLDAEATAPHVGGQLHVFLLDNDAGQDDVYFKHYRVDYGCASPTPPKADAGPDVVLECASPTGTPVTLDGTGSVDPDGDALTYHWSAPGIRFSDASSASPSARFPLGATPVTLEVSDRTHRQSDTVVVTVVDTAAPTISLNVEPGILWPPNHRLVPVFADVRVADTCDPRPRVALRSVVSDEPDNGPGDGDTSGDIRGASLGTADFWFRLRAERSRQGDGRTYHIAYQATDRSGNAVEAGDDVRVPRRRVPLQKLAVDHVALRARLERIEQDREPTMSAR